MRFIVVIGQFSVTAAMNCYALNEKCFASLYRVYSVSINNILI